MSTCCKCKEHSRVMYFKDLHNVISEESKIDEFKCDKCGDKVEKYKCKILTNALNENGNNDEYINSIWTTTGIKNSDDLYEYYFEL